MKAFAVANLAVAFLLEVAALVAFAWWGFEATEITLARITLAIAAPIVVAVFWGTFMAPTAKRRVSGAVYYVFQAVVFGLAAAALWLVGKPVLAIVFAVVYVVNTVLVRLTRQYADLSQFGRNDRIGG